jgi:hypothetical protein
MVQTAVKKTASNVASTLLLLQILEQVDYTLEHDIMDCHNALGLCMVLE